MAVIVNGDGILTGISSLATALTDITSGRGTVTGVATVGTLQLGAGVSISSPRTQQAAIFTNNTEFLTVDDAGRVGVGTITPNSDAHPENEKKINVGFITARSIAGDVARHFLWHCNSKTPGYGQSPPKHVGCVLKAHPCRKKHLDSHPDRWV